MPAIQPQNTSSPSPHPTGSQLRLSSTPRSQDPSLPPQGSRGQGELSPSHPTWRFQGLHHLWCTLPAQILSWGERDRAGCCSEGGKVAVIPWEWGNGTEQDTVTHSLELAAGRGVCESRPPAPTLVLAHFCPRHDSLEVLGKGKTEFSKPQGLPGNSLAAYLFIHLLPAAVPPAWQGGGKVGAAQRSQEQSLLPSCCWPSKFCSSSCSWNGFLP